MRPLAHYAERYPSLAMALARAASLETLDEAGFERGLAVLLAPDPA